MDKLSAFQAFVSVVEQDGFAAAARKLGKSRSAVNRMVIELENDLATQLLNRTTRNVSPTANGQAFYDRAKQILSSVADAEESLRSHQEHASGRVKINAPMSFGTLHLSSAIADFMAQHPGLEVELTLNDRIVDIVEEGYDLAVRIAEPDEETTFVDFRLCKVRRLLVASPDYIRTRGKPAHPRELKTHASLNYGAQSTESLWRLEGPEGPLRIRLNPVLCSNNGEVLRDGAVRGLGIAVLPTFIAGPDLQQGRLVSVLDEFSPGPLVLSVIYPPARHLSTKIRLLTDFLAERFGSQPRWDLVT
ncbi:MAG: LysR substrate-binding domain-containing protein [Pseudomonadota bacterium]